MQCMHRNKKIQSHGHQGGTAETWRQWSTGAFSQFGFLRSTYYMTFWTQINDLEINLA